MWESEFKRRKRREEAERKEAATLARCAEVLSEAGDTVAILGPVEADNGVTRHHRHPATGYRIAHTAYTGGQHTLRIIDDSSALWVLVAEGCVMPFSDALAAVRL